MTKATTQPAVRAEGRSPRRARSPPAWRIETSLRRKGVRGGGSGRACGAKAVRGGGSRRACGAPVCACGKRERRGQAEPLSHQARRYPSRASPYCPSEATRTTSRDWARRQIYESHLTQGGVRPTTFGVGFRRLSCGGGRPPPALVFNHLTLYAAWCRRCTGREWPGPRSCYSSSDLSIACSVAAAARFARESEAGREGIIC